MIKPTKQCLSFVAVQSRDEVTTFTEHIQEVQDSKDDMHITTGQQCDQMFHTVV